MDFEHCEILIKGHSLLISDEHIHVNEEDQSHILIQVPLKHLLLDQSLR